MFNAAQAGQKLRAVVEQDHARGQQKRVVHPQRGLVAVGQGVVQRTTELRVALAVRQQLFTSVVAAANVFEAGIFSGKRMPGVADVHRVEVPTRCMKRARTHQFDPVGSDGIEQLVPARQPGSMAE